MSNLFESIRRKFEDSPAIVMVALVSLAAMLVGLNHGMEDVTSSYWGIQWLETIFNVRPASYALTYLTMSLTPSIGQALMGYLFLLNPRKYWWAVPGFLLFFIMDSTPDVWYRSNENFFADSSTAISSIYITLVYFTIASEGFVTLGFGLLLATGGPALEQFGVALQNFRRGWEVFRDAIWTPEDEETQSVRQPVQNVPGTSRRGEPR